MHRVLTGIAVLILLAGACRDRSEKDHSHNAEAPDEVEESPNLLLYNEVMKVHDEVMPKIEDIYRKKEALKDQIANNPNMPEERKKAIDATIARLDSAAEGMMAWMRKFNPLPDSAGEEKARAYLEDEMERIRKVREDILDALKEADTYGSQN